MHSLHLIISSLVENSLGACFVNFFFSLPRSSIKKRNNIVSPYIFNSENNFKLED